MRFRRVAARTPSESTDRADTIAGPLLDVRGLRVRVGGARGGGFAVDGVDLRIERGEVLALVGESGSGKSLTARAIVGLLPSGTSIHSGEIRLNGVDLVKVPESRLNHVRGRQIGLLFQQPRSALDPTSRIGHWVSEARRTHFDCSRHDAWNTALELLNAVGIADAGRRARGYAHQMSGGMAQRVGIASALSGEPLLLIADEPTTALDVTVQAQILRLLALKQAEHGLSILLITHDLGIVPGIANRVAVMYAGRIVEQGSVEEVLEHAQHPYTRALLQASLLEGDADGRLFAIPGSPGTGPARLREPGGCRFCGRCSLTGELGILSRCASEDPELVRLENQHATRCWAAVEW